jgi:hypothetical protein
MVYSVTNLSAQAIGKSTLLTLLADCFIVLSFAQDDEAITAYGSKQFAESSNYQLPTTNHLLPTT